MFNPFKNLIAPFTPFGLGVTAVVVLLICLITKKGYSWLSGYKFVKDKRGFDILPDGTHGTSALWDRRERARILETGPVEQLTGTVLGKYKDDPDDDDKYAEYVTLKKGSGLTEHTMVYGAPQAPARAAGLVKPFILQCAKRGESLILVDPKGEFYETCPAFSGMRATRCACSIFWIWRTPTPGTAWLTPQRTPTWCSPSRRLSSTTPPTARSGRTSGARPS